MLTIICLKFTVAVAQVLMLRRCAGSSQMNSQAIGADAHVESAKSMLDSERQFAMALAKVRRV